MALKMFVKMIAVKISQKRALVSQLKEDLKTPNFPEGMVLQGDPNK